MQRRTLLAGTAALATAPLLRARAQAPAARTKIVWWHAMTAALGEQVNNIANAFNQGQQAFEVQPIYKGGYADLLNATIAASRAGQAPHIAQIFEVGTGTSLSADRRPSSSASRPAGIGCSSSPMRNPVASSFTSSASPKLDTNAIVASFDEGEVTVDELFSKLERATTIIESLEARLALTKAKVDELTPRISRVADGE